MGIPLRLKNGRLTVDMSSSSGCISKRKQALLPVSHRSRRQGKGVRKEGEMKPFFKEGAGVRGRLQVSYSSGGKTKKPRRQPIVWRVVNIYLLSEYRDKGEQRTTIKDATLPGIFTGYSERQARIRAERKYGELPYAKYALLRMEEWRVVRNQKGWPPTQDIEDSEESATIGGAQLSLLP